MKWVTIAFVSSLFLPLVTSVQAADTDHIRQLLQTNECIGCNLGGAQLSGLNLIDANLEGATLSGADLSGTQLLRANLQSANLTGANVAAADFTGANLQQVNLTNVQSISGCSFDPNSSDETLQNSHPAISGFIVASCLSQWSFTAQDHDLLSDALSCDLLEEMPWLWFTNSFCQDNSLPGTLPSEVAQSNFGLFATFGSINNTFGASQTTFRGADLSHANLRDAQLGGANFRYATLTEADATGANFSYALLVDADIESLRNANLTGAWLTTDDIGASLQALINVFEGWTEQGSAVEILYELTYLQEEHFFEQGAFASALNQIDNYDDWWKADETYNQYTYGILSQTATSVVHYAQANEDEQPNYIGALFILGLSSEEDYLGNYAEIYCQSQEKPDSTVLPLPPASPALEPSCPPGWAEIYY